MMNGEWRPIKTAPKDGTEIILTDGEYVAADKWTRWAGYPASWHEFQYLKPTHWMPLPKAPRHDHP